MRKTLTFFSQNIYFFLTQNDYETITDDDKSFFCFSTVPAIFLYFITKESQETALLFFENLFDFHFYIYPQINPNLHNSETELPNFLNDIVFGYFLATNPGLFFENAIVPVLNSTLSFIQDRVLYYIKT